MTRLIDADKLKKALSEPLYRSTIKDFGEVIEYTHIMNIIDNAPTVKFSLMPADETKEDAYKRGYEKGKIDGILKALKEKPQGEWIPVSERLPEERINPYTKDFEYVLCSTNWGDVRPYKFGKRIGENKAHFWLCGGIMDKYITAWQPLPEPYKKGSAE